MITPITSRYAGVIGLGIMYLWAATIFVWIDWIKSDTVAKSIVGIIGVLLASASGVSAFLYLAHLEARLKELEESNVRNESQAHEWMDQAQFTISLLEKEHKKNRKIE